MTEVTLTASTKCATLGLASKDWREGKTMAKKSGRLSGACDWCGDIAPLHGTDEYGQWICGSCHKTHQMDKAHADAVAEAWSEFMGRD